MTGSASNNPVLYPHSVDFTGRPPPPNEGYSWEHIKEAIDSNSLHALRRTDKGQYEYEQWQGQIDRSRYSNVGEYIVYTILHWPDLKDPAEAEPAVGSDQTLVQRYRATEPRITIRLNHYPFPVQESIQYFVLWSSRDMSMPEERKRLDLYLKQQFEGIPGTSSKGLSPELLPPAPGKKKNWMWFVNPIELRSVATVHHLHVFVRDIDL
ncbi:hypothetical protein BC939DRAFT_446698 [Gamsiella multidivaricata]|uniref:uncharacterized protein n=1 Tax=Gamsiella multidivaricata TaxID=101098 RepID=UPI00221F0DC9|nr:uncharacterized protein BC939DRAFT_446698 [Gamsiella multidivaricata]KAI7826546.1 hypothetical protein BC939DRAFT_446698 [Gamsiella multidivaricata]